MMKMASWYEFYASRLLHTAPNDDCGTRAKCVRECDDPEFKTSIKGDENAMMKMASWP